MTLEKNKDTLDNNELSNVKNENNDSQLDNIEEIDSKELPQENNEELLNSSENKEISDVANENNELLNDILDVELDETPKESNEEYLKLLDEIKNRVSKEKTMDTDLNDTVVLNRDELDKALNDLENNNNSAEEQLNISEYEENNYEEKEQTTFIPPLLNQNDNVPQQEEKPIALELLGVKKRIGLKTIVEDITFSMREGEIIGLLGPNGSGKTTIMRMIVGLTKISKGDIYCFERPLGLGNTKMLTEVGSMIESPEFYNYMSGYSNLKQIARLSGKKITRSKLKELIKFVGLEKAARKKVKTYSLGMRQRLGLAQALLHDPKVLILDEPVNGLDPQGVQEFRNKLKEIAANGVSILISSHLLDEIEKVSDRIIVLEKGKIIVDEHLDKLRATDIEKTLISTYDDDRAVSLINELDIPYALTKEGFIFEDLSRAEKAQIISYLTNSNVEIHEINVLQKTLEERFLELTSKGGQI